MCVNTLRINKCEYGTDHASTKINVAYATLNTTKEFNLIRESGLVEASKLTAQRAEILWPWHELSPQDVPGSCARAPLALLAGDRAGAMCCQPCPFCMSRGCSYTRGPSLGPYSTWQILWGEIASSHYYTGLGTVQTHSLEQKPL